MRYTRFAAALALVGAPLSAQDPAPAAPAPAAGSVTVPAGPVVPQNAKAEGSSWELRVGGIMMVSAQRNSEFFSKVSESTGSVKGVDALLRGSGFGLSFRSLSGNFGTSQPQVISADARILLGPQGFSINAGASRRLLYTTTGSKMFEFALGGVSMTWNIGGSGVRTLISADYYYPIRDASKKMKNGMEGEAGFIWRLPAVPFYVQVGYRTEVFNQLTNSVQQPEEVRGVRVGGGIQFGGN